MSKKPDQATTPLPATERKKNRNRPEAIERFEAAVTYEMERSGCKRPQAVLQVSNAQADLRNAYLDAREIETRLAELGQHEADKERREAEIRLSLKNDISADTILHTTPEQRDPINRAAFRKAFEALRRPEPEPPPIVTADMPVDPTVARSRKPTDMSGDALALAVLTDHPEWTNNKIANTIGYHPKSLYRFKKFQYARELLDRGRDDIPKGSKSRDGQIEAWNNDE